MALAYDSLQLCRNVLTLPSGRPIHLASLSQERTYRGLIEGYPRRSMNDLTVTGAARRRPYEGGLHVIAPPRRDYLVKPGDMAGEPTLLGMPPEWLPGVQCVGQWESTRTERTPEGDASRLTVVWWQEDYAMPIDAAILDVIRTLDWEALATDFTV